MSKDKVLEVQGGVTPISSMTLISEKIECVPTERAFGQLFAKNYRVGDRVMGDDPGIGGEPEYGFGEIVGLAGDHCVIVRWDDAEYGALMGTCCNVFYLALWPPEAQAKRLRLAALAGSKAPGAA